jgi:sugar lactone lactonase YvrE
VYWVSDGHIMKVGIAGGQSTELAYSSTGADSLAVDGSHLYWIRGNDNAVMQVGIDGGAVEAVNAPTNTDQYVSSVAIDASVLYWADSLGAVFARTPADGVRVVVPRGGAGPARGLVFDATDAYWIAGDQIYRAPK